MNPEFTRNVWLELTPRRVLFMTVVLALIFFAAAVSGGSDWRPAAVAVFLYYFLVVFWGSRNAALAVVGEIRDRTWDSQRLSSLNAGQMTWGKLFGSTIYNWFGGGICLAVILTRDLVHQGVLHTLVELVYYIAVGVISQAASLLASLVAIRRKQRHTRLEIFVYQMAGIVAAIAVLLVWEAADPAGALLMGRKATDTIVWWGQIFDTRQFLLVSLAIFAAWTLVGCYREMRLELSMTNGPFVWLGFLVFIGLYTAGFDAWLTSGQQLTELDAVGRRLALAGSTFATLTYVMVLLEPKDRVLYRWIAGQIVTGRIDRAFYGFQAWMMSYIAALAVVVALTIRLIQFEGGFGEGPAVIVAGLGFLTRDVSIFVRLQSLPGRRRGDFAAVVVLFALYALLPAILGGLDLGGTLFCFYPKPTDPAWLGPVAAWTEAILVAATTIARLATGERSRARLAPA